MFGKWERYYHGYDACVFTGQWSRTVSLWAFKWIGHPDSNSLAVLASSTKFSKMQKSTDDNCYCLENVEGMPEVSLDIKKHAVLFVGTKSVLKLLLKSSIVTWDWMNDIVNQFKTFGRCFFFYFSRKGLEHFNDSIYYKFAILLLGSIHSCN